VQKELSRLTEEPSEVSPHELAATLRQVNVARREAMSPAESLIEALHPWVAFVIMPIFALANAGVSLGGVSIDGTSLSVVLGITTGLVLGKPVGIMLAMWLTLKTGLGTLPRGLTLRHFGVLGVVAGVGFTMALFIAQLAFTDARLLAAAKVGILGASVVAAVVTLGLGRLVLRARAIAGAAQSADEAERSTEM
jgi:Na+:H+ antiporter, NhaA family